MSSPPARFVRLATAISVGSAWDGLLQPWLVAACERLAAGGSGAWVITPSRSISYYLKERALAAGSASLACGFLVPAELRDAADAAVG
jgi:hypothetical protein